MKQLNIREAREGLSHPETLFADAEEVLVVRRGEPVARILPATPRAKSRSMREFLASQALQAVPSEALISEEREDRC